MTSFFANSQVIQSVRKAIVGADAVVAVVGVVNVVGVVAVVDVVTVVTVATCLLLLSKNRYFIVGK